MMGVIYLASIFIYVPDVVVVRPFDILLAAYFVIKLSSPSVGFARRDATTLAVFSILLWITALKAGTTFSFADLLSKLQYFLILAAGFLIKRERVLEHIGTVFWLSAIVSWLIICSRFFWIGDSSNFRELLIQYRLLPGLNNTAFTFMGSLMICVFAHIRLGMEGNHSRIRNIIIFSMFVVGCIYPSRQLLMMTVAFMFILLFSRKTRDGGYIYIVAGSVIIAFALGITDFVLARFEQHLALGNEYSRLEQYSIAWQLFQTNPIFGVSDTLAGALSNTRFSVLESGYSTLVVRYGLVGLTVYISYIAILITGIRSDCRVLLLPPFFGALFNEILFVEMFAFILIFASLCFPRENPQFNEEKKEKYGAAISERPA